MQTRLVEWHSPDFHNPYNWPFAILLMVGVVSWAVSTRRPAWSEVLLFVGTTLAGLVSMRHIPIFAIVAAPIVAGNLLNGLSLTRFYGIFSGEGPATPPNRAMTIVNWGVVGVFVLLTVVRSFSVIEQTDKLIQERYPAAAVDFLEREGLTEQRGYNSYNWGGYLIWRGIPVFVDGRADVYGDDFLREYFRAFAVEQNWQQPLEDYDVSYWQLPISGARSIVTTWPSSLRGIAKRPGRWRASEREEGFARRSSYATDRQPVRRGTLFHLA
jgi:hypothetical protein